MIREIRYKISADTKSIEPKTRQWAGMQYEDNATEIQFDISAIIHSKGAIAVRIDFNSAAAGYHPSENLTTRGGGIYSREIPKYITQYGGELQVTAVITVANSANTGATDIVYSYPVEVYFTPVEKSENGNTDVEGNISEMEKTVKEAEERVFEYKAEASGYLSETMRLSNDTAQLYEEIIAADVTAEKLAETKQEAEDLIYTVEKKLENGAFVGEQGPVGPEGPQGAQGVSGVYVGSGEMPDGYNIQIDPEGSADFCTEQTYNPKSPNAQSGVAVAEAVSTKANLEFAPINITDALLLEGTVGVSIHTLSNIDSMVIDPTLGLCFYAISFDESLVIQLQATEQEFAKMEFIVGDKYRVSVTNNSVDSIEKVIDLKDKVNVTDFEDALANIGGGENFATIADITLEEAVNSIMIDETTFPDIAKVKDFYIALSIAKPEALQGEKLYISSTTQYNNYILGCINTWNNTGYVLNGSFYSKCFDDYFRFNVAVEALNANNLSAQNLATTSTQMREPLQNIVVACATATSLIPAGSKITIRGYIGK